MTIQKVSSAGKDRYRAIVKDGRRAVASKTFDLKRDAVAWHDSEKSKLKHDEWVDPRLGKEALGVALARWMEEREGSVAGSTLREEGYSLAKVPTSLRNRPIGAVRTTDLDALYGEPIRHLAPSTVKRFRNTLSSFFGWAVKQGLVTKNPVLESYVPKGAQTNEKDEVYPFSLDELHAVHADLLALHGKAKADVALFLGLTGLRWGELAAIRVRDVQLVPYPALRVSRSRPDGQSVRNVTKGGGARTVPLTADALAIVKPLVEGRSADAPLFASPRGQMLSGNNWKRSVDWTLSGRGRRVQDLRHTAATIWLTNGIDVKQVQKWLGHSTALLTLQTYSHWMGTDADVASVAKLDALRGYAGGTAKEA